MKEVARFQPSAAPLCQILVHYNPRTCVCYLVRRLCNSLLYGLPASHLNKVQRVLNAAARLVCQAPRYCAALATV